MRECLRTLRAVHHAVLRIDVASGGAPEADSPRTLVMSGFLAIAYPGRLRLRATAFAGVTLFDLLYIDGHTELLSVHEDLETKGPVALLWPELARDLALAFGLGAMPEYGRLEAMDARWILHTTDGFTELARPEGLVLRELRGAAGAEREIWLGGHLETAGVVLPRTVRIRSRGARYEVEVEVRKVEPNVELDPRLFAP